MRTALEMRLIVVSNPAVTSSTALATCSWSLEDVALLVRRLQRGEESGALAVPSRDEVGEEVAEALHVADPALAGSAGRIEYGGDAGIPRGGVDAEEEPRDLHRQRERQQLVHVASATGGELVDDPLGGCRDVGPHGARPHAG